jgi:opacity protein-like surface antigen
MTKPTSSFVFLRVSLMVLVSFVTSMSLLNAKIGQNHLGLHLGSGDFEFNYSANNPSPSVDTLDANPDGFAFALDGNYNFYAPNEQNYGIDIPFRFLSAQTSGAGNAYSGSTQVGTIAIDVDLSIFQVHLRPYYQFDKLALFADLGLSYVSVDGDLSASGITLPIGKGNKTSFSGGVGAELNVTESLSVSLSVNWSDVEMFTITDPTPPAETLTFEDENALTFTVPVTYSLNDKLDVVFTYSLTDLGTFKEANYEPDPVDKEDTAVTEISFIGLGLGYKF